MKLIGSMALTVDIDAGTDLSEAAQDICTIATRLGCNVQGDFNGVMLCAQFGGSYKELQSQYAKAIKSKKSVKIAFSK